MTRPTSPTTPSRLIGGRYAVLGELGRGGMGVVWLAEDRVIGRQVAVKEMHLADGLDPTEREVFRQRLLREARAAGRLNDPAVVTVHDVVTEDGVDHIVMELVRARTLADAVGRDGPLPPAVAAGIAVQLLSALRTAHDAGVVHRDVKPANVMLAAGGRVKLADFGIAHAADDTRLTGTGLLIGSPGYLSPEQLDGHPAGPASDLWALGATLYYAVEGRGPFARDTTAATMSAVLHADIPPSRVGGPVGTVIAGLLQRDPRRRLTGAMAELILSTPPTAPVPVAQAPTVVRPEPPYTPPPAPQSSPKRWKWLLAGLGAGAALGLAAGLVLGLLGGAAGVAATGWFGGGDLATLTYGTGGAVPQQALIADACFAGRPVSGQPIPQPAMRACVQAHGSEVIGTLDPNPRDQQVGYPGEAALTTLGSAACALWRDTVVAPDRLGDQEVTVLIPSEAAFTTGDGAPQRTVYCVLSTAGGELTGSSQVR